MEKNRSISLEEAVELLLENTEVIEEYEIVAIEQAIGRICGEDVRARFSLPPFDRSPLDGYAINRRDVALATKKNPISLRVVDHIYAGGVSQRAITSGEAVRIMTGAMLPEGADGVIAQEDTDYGEEVVRVYKDLGDKANICLMGEDVRQGAVLLKKGEKIFPVHVGILAGQGIGELLVFKRPKVGIITTGDELVPLNESLSAGKIYDVNGPLLCARLNSLGLTVKNYGIRADNGEDIGATVKQALDECHVVITTGGVSVGQKDYMEKVAGLINGQVLFHGIKIKPGSPALVAKVREKLVICLSGNPYAAIATFELVARPMLEQLSGNSCPRLNTVEARLKGKFNKPSPMRRLVRGVIQGGEVYIPEEGHSSGILSTLPKSNCMVDIPAGSKAAAEGDLVSVILL